MSINEGDLLMIEEIHTDPDWVISQMNGREGLVPAPYVQVISKVLLFYLLHLPRTKSKEKKF